MITGAYRLGRSSGAITAGHGNPVFLTVLTYVALYQTAIQRVSLY